MESRSCKDWSPEEIRMLKRGELPKTRTEHAARQFCSRMKITYPGKRFQERNGK